MNTQRKRRKKLTATEARNFRTLLLLSVFDSQAIGDRIAQARNETGLKQDEIADLVGVSTRSWQGYEAGEVVPYRHMRRIEEITRRSVVWLLHGDVVEEERDAKLAGLDERLSRIERLLESLVAQGDPPNTKHPASHP